MSMLVFPLLGYALTHSTTQAALATTAFFAAGTIVRLPAGALVDRWSRRRVLLISNLASAAVLGMLALLVATGVASIALLVAAAVLAGVAEAFFSPAASASLRAVVAPEDLAQAYTRMQARHHVASLIGPPLGGALFAVAASLPFAVDAVTFAGFGGGGAVPAHPAAGAGHDRPGAGAAPTCSRACASCGRSGRPGR